MEEEQDVGGAGGGGREGGGGGVRNARRDVTENFVYEAVQFNEQRWSRRPEGAYRDSRLKQRTQSWVRTCSVQMNTSVAADNATDVHSLSQ
jgi:hypothetical protein